MITNYKAIIQKLEFIDPVKYSKDRNFIDGSVSMLSPYISRGVLSTKQIFLNLRMQGYEFSKIEKFIQELAWRDYWQLIWQEKDINVDIKNKQIDTLENGISNCIVEAKTGINAIDSAIKKLYSTGYMHNHLRMYIAFLSTNIGKNKWNVPASWMYYYLLDGDCASNALSWQWICGANSNKKYIANQENINRYTYSTQSNTFLDTSYENISQIKQPSNFKIISNKIRKTSLPTSEIFSFNDDRDICLYNYYNLDPIWRCDLNAHRVLIIEPSIFERYPISNDAMNFMLKLSKNIPNIKVFVGEFINLPNNSSKIYFKEHPLNYNYKGIIDSRDWLSSVKGYYPSFFSFWKKVKNEIKFI